MRYVFMVLGVLMVAFALFSAWAIFEAGSLLLHWPGR